MNFDALNIKTVKHKKEGQLTTARRFYEADSLLNWVVRWSFYERVPVFVGCYDRIVQKLAYDSTQEWIYQIDDPVYGAVVDHKQNVYFCHRGDESSEGNVVKLDKDGSYQYSFNVDDPRSIAVDMDGYVYLGLGNGDIVKTDPEGAKMWQKPFARRTLAVDVDSSGNIYAGSDGSELLGRESKVSKLDSAGDILWEYKEFGTHDVNGVGVDVDGNVYAGSSDDKVHKIDPNGGKVWEYTAPRWVRAVTVDLSGDVYAGIHALSGEYDKVRKIDSAGNLVWEWQKHIQKRVSSLAVDPEGMVYVGLSGILNKLDPDGNEVWEYTDLGSNPQVAVSPGRVGAFHSVW